MALFNKFDVHNIGFKHGSLIESGGACYCDNPHCLMHVLPSHLGELLMNTGPILSMEYGYDHYSGPLKHGKELKVERQMVPVGRRKLKVQLEGCAEVTGWFCSNCASLLEMIGAEPVDG